MADSGAYPRDMIGYGRNAARSPTGRSGARVAVQFVVNYEEGGENNILHGDAASEAFLSEIVGAAPWPGMRHMNMESIYEYGSRAGFWRLHRLFTERSVPVTVYAVATAMARNREAVAAMKEAGWEIATHGLKWIDYRDTPPEIEARHIAEAVRIHTEVAGARPLGFYQGRSSINTIRLGMEEGGFLYCADTYADDLPYWLEGPRGPQLMMPYTLDANDMRFATPQGFNSGDQFYAYLKDSFDTLYAEGDVGAEDDVDRPALPPRRPARTRGSRSRASSTMRWATTASGFRRRLDIARHWIAKHPPPGGWKPSRLTRTLFIERFGGVYEHSPWIAAAAYDAGLASGADTAEGLGEGARRRGGEGDDGTEARADRGPPGSGRQARARQDADRRIRRASRRAPGSTGSRPRNCANSPSSTTPIARGSAFPSSWRSRARAKPTFSPPSAAVSPTTPTRRRRPRSPRSTGSPRSGSRTSCLERAARVIRGRILSFTDDPAESGSRAYSLIEDGAVLVAGGLIEAVGEARDILARAPAGRAHRRSFRLRSSLPGFIDAHIHYPQTQVIGSYGAQLLDWLHNYTFVEEQKFADPAHCARVAAFFLDELFRSGTTTAMVYCTVHPESVDAFFAEARSARRAHDRRQGDDGPRRAGGAHGHRRSAATTRARR